MGQMIGGVTVLELPLLEGWLSLSAGRRGI